MYKVNIKVDVRWLPESPIGAPTAERAARRDDGTVMKAFRCI
jgi:hypothetical protein